MRNSNGTHSILYLLVIGVMCLFSLNHMMSNVKLGHHPHNHRMVDWNNYTGSKSKNSILRLELNFKRKNM